MSLVFLFSNYFVFSFSLPLFLFSWLPFSIIVISLSVVSEHSTFLAYLFGPILDIKKIILLFSLSLSSGQFSWWSLLWSLRSFWILVQPDSIEIKSMRNSPWNSPLMRDWKRMIISLSPHINLSSWKIRSLEEDKMTFTVERDHVCIKLELLNLFYKLTYLRIYIFTYLLIYIN